MNCKYGTITKIVDGDNAAIGINHDALADKSPCRVDAEDNGPFKNKKCSGTINKEKVQADFDANCAGKDHCTLSIYDFKSPEKFNKNYFPSSKDNGDCYSPTS